MGPYANTGPILIIIFAAICFDHVEGGKNEKGKSVVEYCCVGGMEAAELSHYSRLNQAAGTSSSSAAVQRDRGQSQSYNDRNYPIMDDTNQNAHWSCQEGSVAAYAIQGDPSTMEDTYSIEKKDHFLAVGVFDGHKGPQMADYLALHLLPSILTTLSHYNKNPKIYGQLIKEMILRNEHFAAQVPRSATSTGLKIAGSAVLVAVQFESTLIIANVGHSRAVGKRSDTGKAQVLNREHRPIEERHRIEGAGAVVTEHDEGVWRVNGNPTLTRSIGDYNFKKENRWLLSEPDIYEINLEKEPLEFVVLATDCLWDVYKNEEVIEIVEGKKNRPFFGAQKLAKGAVRLCGDNVAVVVMKLK